MMNFLELNYLHNSKHIIIILQIIQRINKKIPNVIEVIFHIIALTKLLYIDPKYIVIFNECKLATLIEKHSIKSQTKSH